MFDTQKLFRNNKNFIFNLQADQICYAVLCVFSYVAAGPEKRLQGRQSLIFPTTQPTPPPPSEPKPPTTQEQQTLRLPSPQRQTPESGSVTPVTGPPTYPPPALPPGVQPPAPPPGLKGFVVPAQLPGGRPARPPPVPSRNLNRQPSSPQPPPRQK